VVLLGRMQVERAQRQVQANAGTPADVTEFGPVTLRDSALPSAAPAPPYTCSDSVLGARGLCAGGPDHACIASHGSGGVSGSGRDGASTRVEQAGAVLLLQRAAVTSPAIASGQVGPGRCLARTSNSRLY
jgi:hypothetical protein